jgi:hypothetical protein
VYLEHLTDVDLALLAASAGEDSGNTHWRDRLWRDPAYLSLVLGLPALFDRLFASGDDETMLRASPFLVFASLLTRAAQDLQAVQFVQEWVGPGRRVPVFDVADLQDFAAGPPRRLFLAEVLASYTRVASGSTWVHTPRGWRRRRFSELDLLRLIELLTLVPSAERAAVYRRLGDLALFLTGVFPDFSGGRLLPSVRSERLHRALRQGDLNVWDQVAGGPGSGEDMRLLEAIGRRSYERAGQASEPGAADVLVDVAESFDQARRMLNFLTDRYLFPLRHRWFPADDS